MLVNNFSAGIIWGMILAILGFFVIGPFVKVLFATWPVASTSWSSTTLLPLTSIFIEPAKILFLNNAINHGVSRRWASSRPPSRASPSSSCSKPTRARAWACCWPTWCSARAPPRQSAAGAAIIHFFGGIHEIYFPYVLMPSRSLILAVIAGGMTGVFINVLFHSGLRAPAAPARSSPSTPRPRPTASSGSPLSWILGAAVTFLVAALPAARPTRPTTRATSRPRPPTWRR
jgi:PTS system mannitol-specific IIC component